jgi:hypothetical protein
LRPAYAALIAATQPRGGLLIGAVGDEIPPDQVRGHIAGSQPGAFLAAPAAGDALDPGHGHDDLKATVISALRRLQKHPGLVRGFFADPCLRYITA